MSTTRRDDWSERTDGERHARAHAAWRLRALTPVVRRVRPSLSLFVLDALLIFAAYLAVLVLRFDGAVPDSYWGGLFRYLPLALVVHLASDWGWGLHRQMWRHASVHEARRVIAAGVVAAAVLLPANLALGRLVPFSVAVLGPMLTTLLLGVVRFQARLLAPRPRANVSSGLRVVLIGAGEAGASILREMRRNPAAGFTPVAVLDDDPRKWGQSLLGVPVVGPVAQLAAVVHDRKAHRALLAIPSGNPGLTRRVAHGAEAAKVPLLVVPGLDELMQGRARLRDVRDIRIEDLVGRQEVTTDLESVHLLLGGRRVLITGGGGSIGCEIARQVAGFGPDRLVLLDHDETHLHDTAGALDTDVTTVLADVRDAAQLARAFDRHRPDIVFHAAAHKHVPILEAYPCEAVATNVLGTANVVAAASAVGVERVIFISTDKAVRPTSVMGASKWLGEQVLLARAPAGARFSAVRFGNVLGSRGSVIPTFSRQIANGGPVTVTDPDMTRFFMSIEEAVQLVLQAAVFAEGGEVFMLEMGEAVNILALAERMIRLSGYAVGDDIAIEVVGARPGEKRTEELYTPDEARTPTPHAGIFRVEPVRLPAGLLDAGLVYCAQAVARYDDGAARALVDVANGRASSVLGGDHVVDLAATTTSGESFAAE